MLLFFRQLIATELKMNPSVKSQGSKFSERPGHKADHKGSLTMERNRVMDKAIASEEGE